MEHESLDPNHYTEEINFYGYDYQKLDGNHQIIEAFKDLYVDESQKNGNKT